MGISYFHICFPRKISSLTRAVQILKFPSFVIYDSRAQYIFYSLRDGHRDFQVSRIGCPHVLFISSVCPLIRAKTMMSFEVKENNYSHVN